MMIAISLHKVARSFPSGTVFTDISWEIKSGQKIGFLGTNGIGKTTLLKIISGDLPPDQGTVTRARGLRVGRLQQIPDRRQSESLVDYVRGGRSDLIAMQKKIEALSTRLATTPEDAELAAELGEAQHEYEVSGGFELEYRAQRTLTGLGFPRAAYTKLLNEFSGGERTRAELARLLLADDEVILLDEPTNHLDLAAIEWLEDFISKTPKAVIFVSHDRIFLDRVAGSLVELSAGKLEFYGAGYKKYRAERERRWQKQRREHERQKQEIARIEDFIVRNIAGQKTVQAQSRRRALGKLERIEKPDADLDKMRLQFKSRVASYREVLTVSDYTRKVGERTLLKDVSFLIERGDKVGLIGPNGSGKTTLLRGIVQLDHDYTGRIKHGPRVLPAYFDQLLESITDFGSVIDHIWDEYPAFKAFELRSFLARFLFSGEDVFKQVSTLSGGEKSRLALAKLMLSDANFLLLDEPTNHLDIPAREVLEEALAEYEGTILVVSHDRYFLDRLINKLMIITESGIELHLGNYSDYLAHRGKAKKQTEAQTPAGTRSNSEWEKLRQQRRDKQKRERDKQKTEREIQQTEERLLEIDELLADEVVQCDWEKLAELGDEKKMLQSRLETLYPRWEELTDQ